MVKNFSQKIIDTSKKVLKGGSIKSGKHIILYDNIAKKLNDYCEEKMIVRRRLVNKIIKDWLKNNVR